ncbi:MAG: OprD family porin [Betaproteobacteria bacterium]|nr:OprD family porin [Betaproteobacteria bacterium]
MRIPASLVCFLTLFFSHPLLALASDEAAPATAQEQAAEPGESLLPTVSGNLFYFNRHRRRYDIGEGRFLDNLRHQTLQGNVEISTPFYSDAVGFDLGAFYTTDLANSASPDHEMSFFPWDIPWSPDWSKRDARSGTSLYRAHLKLQHVAGERRFWGKVGYFQPSGPGVIGVNWSLMPGTYRGLETGLDDGPLSIAFAWADQYKSPWFSDLYHFRKNDGQTRVDYLWSFGARIRLMPGFSAEVAYGESQDFLRSAHLKLKYTSSNEKITLSYQLYGMADRDDSDSENNQYGGHVAHQHYLAAAWRPAPWVLRAEFLHTRAPSSQPQHAGYFAYRLIGRYGGANGAYEPWWDNRSDWNHNKESAVFLGASRSLDDLLGVSGFTVGLSAVYGWGGRVYGVEERLRESAWSADFAYAVPSGSLKNARISLHTTRYRNKTHQPNWTGFKNLFQDERDLKILLVIPWKL